MQGCSAAREAPGRHAIGAAAEAFAAADPYAKAGLFESVVIRPFRTVFKDGKAA
jgi:hypothetical protein